jgi:DNA ligase-associated metallophosphoesterase
MIRRKPKRMTQIFEKSGQRLELLPERAVWWPDRRILMVADLHWGKAEAFQGRGIPVPSGLLTTELERLGRLLADYPVESLYVLGDLIHDDVGITDEVSAEIARWRSANPTPIKLVPGNHDRHLARLPESWSIEVLEPRVLVEPFALVHHPEPVGEHFAFCGHLHPTYVVRGRGDHLRCPCFHVTRRMCVMPAFTEFSGGVKVRREKGSKIYVVAESSVVEL